MERSRKKWASITLKLNPNKGYETAAEELPSKQITIKRVSTFTPRRSARSRDWYMEAERKIPKNLQQFESKEMREILSMEHYDNGAGKYELSDRNTYSNREDYERMKT